MIQRHCPPQRIDHYPAVMARLEVPFKLAAFLPRQVLVYVFREFFEYFLAIQVDPVPSLFRCKVARQPVSQIQARPVKP